MNNFTEVTSFTLSAFYGMEDLNLVYFIVFLIIYITIIAENLLLIGVIYQEKTLHEPMYLLLCNLAVNGLYGSTALLPAMLSKILWRAPEISLQFCETQIYAIHTYAIIEFTILAVMSYDRYLAICFPLLYRSVMSQRVAKLIAFMWLYPLLAFLIFLFYTLQLRFCSSTIEKVYCMNYMLVKLACTDTSVANIIGLVSVVLYGVPQIIMIFYSYAHILRICVLTFGRTKVKALQTCTPHLLSIMNYCIGCFFEIAQSRFNLDGLSYHAKLFLSIYFLIFPPILNPAIYGFSIKVIRLRLFRLIRGKNRQVM